MPRICSPHLARVALVVLPMMAAAGCGRSPVPAEPGSGDPPLSVILIGLDTTRADHLGCYSDRHASTPNLDRLAEEGVRFEQCMSVVPTTLASFTTIMSGLYPRTHQVARNGIPVPDNIDMLAERFKRAGYDTASFIASYALHSDHRFDQGFDRVDEAFDTDRTRGIPERNAARVNEQVIPWLENHGTSPFFLFVHYFDPHAPYAAPSGDRARGADLAKPAWGFGRLEMLRRALRTGRNAEVERLAADARVAYAEEIEYMDGQVGQLVAELDRLDLRRRTLIVVVGDHGENLDEHLEELFDHGATVFEPSIHVPLIICPPAPASAGTIVPDLVSTIDIAPTISALTGLPPSAACEGRDLSRWIHAPEAAPESEPRFIFAEASKPWGPDAEADPRWRNQLKTKCVRSDSWKLVFSPLSGEDPALFSIRKDPGESRNLFAEQQKTHPDRVRALSLRLKEWMERLPDPSDGPVKEPGEDVLKKLRSLGYTH